MNIVHYFLGPERAGGLNKYVRDLVLAQRAAGFNVTLLYPGGGWRRGKTKIVRDHSWNSLDVWRIINPPPVVLLLGVKKPERMLENADRIPAGTREFLAAVQPDVVHIHTWMGFPAALLASVKDIGCPVIYSAHDYFGLCPRVNWIRNDGSICARGSNEDCTQCNDSAPSCFFLQLRNSPFLLRWLNRCDKIKSLLRRLKRRRPAAEFVQSVSVRNYDRLADFYRGLWQKTDLLLFNSNVTREVFQHFFTMNSMTIPITHADIIDRRRIRDFSSPVRRLIFLGSSSPYKGLPLLKRMLERLSRLGTKQWKLDVYGCGEVGPDPENSAISYHGGYRQEQLDEILNAADFVIVPSVCYETFGFVVSEALSRGVPVLASATVGARTLIERINPEFIFHREDELYKKLLRLINDNQPLTDFNSKLCNMPWFCSMQGHVETISNVYRELTARKNNIK